MPCVPLPVATLSIAKSTDPVTELLDAPDRIAEGPAFAAAILISPEEPSTENSAGLPFSVQEPPTVAEPNPFATVPRCGAGRASLGKAATRVDGVAHDRL